MRREIADRLALSERHASIIESILREVIPDRPVWAFGSRAFGTARPYSDLDLAIGGSKALSAPTEYELDEAFDRSMLPIEVDLIDLNVVSERFRTGIQPYFLPVQEPVLDRS